MSNLVPDGWCFSSFGDVADNIKSGLSRRISSQDIGIPVLISGNIQGNKLDTHELKYWYLNDPQGADVNRYKLNDDDLLLCFINSLSQIGKVCVYKDIGRPVIYTTNLFRIVVGSKHCSTFIYNLMTDKVFQEEIQLITKPAVNQASFTKSDLELIRILLPPLPEQQKIAAILTSVDEVIEKTQAQIDKLKDLKTAMMQELLSPSEDSLQESGVGTKQGAAALSNSEGYIPHTEFKDSPIGRIPKSWEVVKLDDVASIVDSMHQTPTFSDIGMPMVRVTEIRQNDILDISGAMLVDDKTFNAFSKNYKPNLGDTLIARVGAYFGATAYIGSNHEFCLGQNTASIRPNNILPEFLFLCLNSESVRSQMNDAVAVGAQPSLSLKAIKELKVILPSHQEQNVISGSINSVSKRVSIAHKKLHQLKNTKKALMQDLLTGKVRVKLD